jgi:hypothetical protein
MGFRPLHTIIKIEKIEVGSTKIVAKADKAIKTAPIELKK